MRKNLGAKTYLYPLPVLIIGTYDEEGNPDAMNAAWGGISDYNQIVLSLASEHKTTKNIQSKKAFTVSFGTEEHLIFLVLIREISAFLIEETVLIGRRSIEYTSCTYYKHLSIKRQVLRRCAFLLQRF